jgi:hypothetical protein
MYSKQGASKGSVVLLIELVMEPSVISQAPLRPGQLVRYLETATRWYFALVRRVRVDEIDLTFFDGSRPVAVGSAQVETLDAFLGQGERTFSRTRSLSELLLTEFDAYLDELLAVKQTNREKLGSRVRQAVDEQLGYAERALMDDHAFSEWRRVPEEFADDDFQEHRGKSILQVFRNPLRSRAVQVLALIDLLRRCPTLNDTQIEMWVLQEITGEVMTTVRDVINRYLDNIAHDHAAREMLLDQAERDLIVELEESKSIDVVGRFDGENVRLREAHRRNFNRRHNPFALLVGQVGEEGIDLQEQCRYVIHYDLEWNPARMEQREGRVDRMGWMGERRDGAKFIDVRFLMLKGTYEERIFHTVMQREQWFQILIGSKKKELGAVPEEIEQEVDQDRITDDEHVGALTADEKDKVMLNIRPE